MMKRRHLITLGLVLLVATLRFASHMRSPKDLDLSYGPDPQQKIRVTRAVAPSDAPPAILLIAGLYWRDGDLNQMQPFASWLSQNGITAIAVAYPTVKSGARWPGMAENIEAAFHYVKREAVALGIDPDHIGVYGRSAGGQLAAYLARGEVSDGPSCLITLDAPFDLTRRADFSVDMLSAIDELVPPEKAATASPALTITPGAAPAFLIQNATDMMITPTQADIEAAALKSVGTEVIQRPVTGIVHAAWPKGEALDQLKIEMLDFIRTKC